MLKPSLAQVTSRPSDLKVGKVGVSLNKTTVEEIGVNRKITDEGDKEWCTGRHHKQLIQCSTILRLADRGLISGCTDCK